MMSYLPTTAVLGIALALAIPQAQADVIPLGAAASYGVLYTGTGGHNLVITDVAINSNIGVGGTGQVNDKGPSTITGSLDFAAANSNQFTTVATNTGPQHR